MPLLRIAHARPYGKKQYGIVEDRREDNCNDKPTCVSLQQKYPSRVDIEGGWTKEVQYFRYGYKQHTAVDSNGLVLGVVTTSVKESVVRLKTLGFYDLDINYFIYVIIVIYYNSDSYIFVNLTNFTIKLIY